MVRDPLLADLDHALNNPVVGDLSEPERLALAVYWLVDRLGDTLDLTPKQAADRIGSMATLAAEHLTEHGR
ncbi:MAG: hypothetical protein JJU27_18365 [Gammaproteobacteria bacterium]|nr:hypothetical protein [Gammaproteobacteria bacterium]